MSDVFHTGSNLLRPIAKAHFSMLNVKKFIESRGRYWRDNDYSVQISSKFFIFKAEYDSEFNIWAELH